MLETQIRNQRPQEQAMKSNLQQLLTEQLTIPPEYSNGLSNHLPMALHALNALGARPARLRAFYDQYITRFEDRQITSVAPPADWLTLRGQIESYAALQAYFSDAIARNGKEPTLRLTVPELMPGVAAAAFHGVIRTAHAVNHGHDGELASALAYWAATWSPLPLVKTAIGGESFDRWTSFLEKAVNDWQTGTGLISTEMQSAARSQAWHELVEAPALPSKPLEALARFAAIRYAATRNFTVLHLVTGCRALQVLAPWCDSEAPAHALRAYVAAYLASGVGSHHTQPQHDLLDWQALHAKAIDSDDDHIIKLVHAATEWSSWCGDDDALWRAAATTALSKRDA